MGVAPPIFTAFAGKSPPTRKPVPVKIVVPEVFIDVAETLANVGRVLSIVKIFPVSTLVLPARSVTVTSNFSTASPGPAVTVI